MVCIAAFIILSLISVFVGFLSLFNKQLGQKYWAVFKKAWHCVFKKVRLQKCDTNFKDDVKNTLLRLLVLKHPKLLKPASIFIETISVLIVFITVWSFIIAIKSLLALWVFGTCNVSEPSQCGLGAQSCTIDQSEPTDLAGKIGRGFSEWGEIFSAIPDRLKTWQEKEYILTSSIPLIKITNDDNQDQTKRLFDFYRNRTVPESEKIAINIVDPGCVVCMQSYRNQKQSGFFDRYFTVANLYAIPNTSGGYKFDNSKLIADYLNSAVFLVQVYLEDYFTDTNFDLNTLSKHSELEKLLRLPTKLIDRLYSESKDNRKFIDIFNYSYDAKQSLDELDAWSKEFGLSKNYRQLLYKIIQSRHQSRFDQKVSSKDALVSTISKNSLDKKTKESIEKLSQKLSEKLNANDQKIKELVEQRIKAKGIPVEIYDHKKHNGLFKI